MSETVQKILLLASGILLTVLLIGIGFELFNRVKAFNSSESTKMDHLIQKSEEAEINKYDGLSISGATAVSYARTICRMVNDVVFYQNEGSRDSGIVYFSVSEALEAFNDESATFRDMKNPDAYRAPTGPGGNGYCGRYIDPLATYYVEIGRIGGVIDKVTITKIN